VKNPNPGPWRVEIDDDEHVGGIVDANGEGICDFGYSTQYYPSEGSLPDEPQLTLILAVAELEDLLRSIVGVGCHPGDCIICGADLQRGNPHFPDCRLAAVLTRIDLARKKAAEG
jgi:hypothetical protein